MLVLGDATCRPYRFLLGLMMRGVPRVSLPSNRPASSTTNDPLVSSAHVFTLSMSLAHTRVA